MHTFDFDKYEEWCALRSTSIGQLEADHCECTRQVAAGAASAGAGLAFSIITFGISLVGTAAGTAMATNAGKKIEIINRELRKRQQRTALTRGTDIARGFRNGTGAMVGGVVAVNQLDPGV